MTRRERPFVNPGLIEPPPWREHDGDNRDIRQKTTDPDAADHQYSQQAGHQNCRADRHISYASEHLSASSSCWAECNASALVWHVRYSASSSIAIIPSVCDTGGSHRHCQPVRAGRALLCRSISSWFRAAEKVGKAKICTAPSWPAPVGSPRLWCPTQEGPEPHVRLAVETRPESGHSGSSASAKGLNRSRDRVLWGSAALAR